MGGSGKHRDCWQDLWSIVWGKEKLVPSLIKLNCRRIVHTQQVFKRSLQRGSVWIKERTALSSSEAVQPCPRRVYIVLVLPLLGWLSPVLQRHRLCIAVLLWWGWRELKKKIKKISHPKMKEKILQDLGTALNHFSRSCGKGLLEVPVGRAVLFLLRMDVWWQAKRKQSMFLSLAFKTANDLWLQLCLTPSNREIIFLVGVTTTNSLLMEEVYY